ncbi:radical SAM family heme chaperone HemW [Bacteroides sp.]|uniref:radical SAM family heme chaperone HemW n=1 Tax=Bacteroides sp. TaxID=29523 RepID=UPI0026068C07|nr:radical SAM family heme chaperone HemW [Bacteroides sp.]MDD3039688.1 radical SAM family heme chaperone HemW [Bacteroides sp.]
MAGIYLHIPFCKTRCIYCDFYSTTHSELRTRYVEALCSELVMRKDYLKGAPIETIYFGGGTPSQLNKEDFELIFHTIHKHYGMEDCREITLEANPDDLTTEYLKMLASLPFNRISMGIQTFDESTLKLLKRRHTANQAIEAVKRSREAGFQNISIDLIYGLPGETIERWERDLQQAVALQPEHISAYHLTYEEGTPIYNMLQKRQVQEVDEEISVRFFSILMEHLKVAGYEHYEISNFCYPGKHSRHNTSYWKGTPYLGCGPSAHSFDGCSREWNIASINDYIEGIEKNNRIFETENRDKGTAYNELIITSIRTMWGIPLGKLEQEYGPKFLKYCRKMAAPYVKNGKLSEQDGTLRLTREGIFISDSIMRDLLFVED